MICVRCRSRARSCAHLSSRSVPTCAAWQHVHCTHTSMVQRVRVSIATADVNDADDNANTRWWLVKLAFDQLDSALENRFARHFLRVCSTSLAAQRDVCDEWKTSIERETRVPPIARQQSDVSRVCGSGVCTYANCAWHCVHTCRWSVLRVFVTARGFLLECVASVDRDRDRVLTYKLVA